MTPGIVRTCLLACALLLVPLPLAHGADGVVVVQESNGFPGGEKSGAQPSRQQVAIDGDRLRVLDTAHSWALFIDLEKKTVHEASVGSKEYIERSFAYYEKYRKDRERNLASQARQFAKKAKRLEDDEARLRKWRDEYRRGGGDPDEPGKIVARLQHFPQDKQTVTILVDRKETQVTLEHYVIRENQCDTPVFDLWTTRDVELPIDVFRFYRELGTFSPEVSAKLSEVSGTVIRCTAVLDTGSLQRTFRSKVTEVRLGEAVTGLMEVPQDWTRRDPDARPAGPVEAAAKLCDECGATIKAERPLRFRPRPAFKGKTVLYACSHEHLKALIAKVKANVKKKGS
jgi:hypothetical protein